MQCEIETTDTVAVWGCGPGCQMAIRSAILPGAEQVVAIDCIPERLGIAEAAGAIAIDFENESVLERLNELTGDKGPEKCIDTIGMEAHLTPWQPDTVLDRAKQMMRSSWIKSNIEFLAQLSRNIEDESYEHVHIVPEMFVVLAASGWQANSFDR